MRPLDPLAPISSLAHLLRSAAAPYVRAEIDRLRGMSPDAAAVAAIGFARGALSLREGQLLDAHAELRAAADAFTALGETEAAALARAEALLATLRAGGQAGQVEARAALAALASSSEGRVRVAALRHLGEAELAVRDVAAAERALLDAFRASGPFADERASILGALGALHVALGAFGAAIPLLEQAVELHDQSGEAAGEALAHGHLGEATLALGDLDRARSHWERQEWLSSRLGHALGRTSSLAALAELALEAGRTADAVELAGFALEAAGGADPPLSPWSARAERVLGQARGALPSPRPEPSPGSRAPRHAAALRNLGRLAALAREPPGLIVAAIAADAVGGARRGLPPERAAAAAIAELPGVAVWVWPSSVTPDEIGRDLAAARATLGEDVRAVLVLRARARVLSPPRPGEVGAEVEEVDAVPLVRAVGGLEEGELVRGVDVPWSADAEATVTRAGFVRREPRA